MGIGTPGMVFCTMLLVAGGAFAQDGGPVVPAGAAKLLATILGEANPGPLRISGPGSGRSEIHRLEANGGTWMIVSAEGEERNGPTGYFAESIEGWRDGRPVLSASEFRLSLEEPELIRASAAAISWSGRHSDLTVTGIAEGGSVSLEGDALVLAASEISGAVSLRGRTAGKLLKWRTGRLSHSDGQFRAEEVSAGIGSELSVGATGLDVSLQGAGPWEVRIEDLLLSPALVDRILPGGGMTLPPADLKLTGRPDAAGAGRHGFDVEITWPSASMRTVGVISDTGEVSLNGIEADGLLAMLFAAGVADPLAIAAMLGLHFSPAEQDADRMRLPAGTGWGTD